MRHGAALPPAGKPKALRLTDCQKYPLALGNQSFGSRQLIDAIVASSSIRLKEVLEGSSIQSLKEFTRQTDAVSFQFQIGTRRDVQRGELVAVPLVDRSLAQTRLTLAVRAGRMLPITSQSFASLLEQTLSQLAVIDTSH